jgi:hypothetical protein
MQLGKSRPRRGEPHAERSAARYRSEHVVDGGEVNRRGSERVLVQARFGELDDVLVAMRNGSVDKLVLVFFARLDILEQDGVSPPNRQR